MRPPEHSIGELFELKLRPLDGKPIWLRRGTSDTDVLVETFVHRYHRPRPMPTTDVATIWDLGSNTGLTMVDLALRFPRAQILGVELDAANAELARMNLRPWSDRCEVIQAAVWIEDGGVRYRRWPGSEHGSTVVAAAMWDSPTPDAEAGSLTLNRLLDRDDRRLIDYVKMDIEGAERFVLHDNTAWSSSVRLISVEVHPPYTIEQCASALTRLGFRAAVQRRWPPCVIGRNRAALTTSAL